MVRVGWKTSSLSWALLGVSGVWTAACGNAKSTAGPRTDQMPAAVQVESTALTVGLASGQLRATVTPNQFAITTTPVTVAQFRACVSVGACAEPVWPSKTCGSGHTALDHATFSRDPSADSLPLTCVAPADAVSYCHWVGGQLPTAEEWLLAARGPDVHEYSWGDDAPTCDHHWLAGADLVNSDQCCGAACSSAATAIVGLHANGASPSGVADVLATRGELIRSEPRSKVASCRTGELGCVVRSLMPGGIDGFMPVTDSALKAPHSPLPVFSFRCVWEGR